MINWKNKNRFARGGSLCHLVRSAAVDLLWFAWGVMLLHLFPLGMLKFQRLQHSVSWRVLFSICHHYRGKKEILLLPPFMVKRHLFFTPKNKKKNSNTTLPVLISGVAAHLFITSMFLLSSKALFWNQLVPRAVTE